MKTYVLDASALLAYVKRGPGGPKVAELLHEAARGRVVMVMSAVNYGEAYARILHDHGEMGAELVWSVVRALPMELVDATPQRAIRAAEIKIQYKLYYADSFAAALALEHKATLVTSDSDFRKLGHGAGVVWLKT